MKKLPSVPRRDPWNKGRLIGQKRPLKPKDVWSIRVRLQVERRARNLALFNLAIDSKLRGCDLVRLQVDDVSIGGRVRDRATIVQKKTGRPVQFEITEQTRDAIQAWLADIRSRSTRYLFPSRVRAQPPLSTRQYARIVHSWVASAGLDSSAYGTHSMRRTKATLIYRRTGNLRAVQLLFETTTNCPRSGVRGQFVVVSNRTWITRMSMFCSSRWVAKLWRSVCGATHLGNDASSAAMWQTRLSWRVVIGLIRSRPGNIHTGGRAMRHQSRNSSNSCGDSMAKRSLRPLPCSTRSIMRLESMSESYSATTSMARSPAP